jgi:hypothetical protein
MRCRLSTHSRRNKACAGQVITEAAIGMSLMTFAWILMTYSNYMGINATRTCMAARHAAWFKGASGNDISASQIDQGFFYQTGLTKVENNQPVKVADLFTGGGNDPKNIGGAGHGPFMVTVSFGVDDVSTATQFPFDLLKTKVPFMPDFPNTISKVKTSCQWEEIGDTWTTFADAIRGIFDSLKSMIPF